MQYQVINLYHPGTTGNPAVLSAKTHIPPGSYIIVASVVLNCTPDAADTAPTDLVVYSNEVPVSLQGKPLSFGDTYKIGSTSIGAPQYIPRDEQDYFLDMWGSTYDGQISVQIYIGYDRVD